MGLNLNSSLIINRETSTPDITRYAMFEESYFSSALEFLSSLYEDVNLTYIAFYEDAAEDDTPADKENSSKKSLDKRVNSVADKVSGIIDKLVKFITEKIDSFISVIKSKLINFKKLYATKTDVLKKFEDNMIFRMEAKLPTEEMLGDTIPAYPRFNVGGKYSDTIDEAISNIKDFVGKTKAGSYYGEKDNKNDIISNQTEYGNTNRGRMLGLDRAVSKEDFSQTARSVFMNLKRDGDDKDLAVCDRGFIAKAYDRINPDDGMAKIIKFLKEAKAKATKDLHKAQSSLKTTRFSEKEGSKNETINKAADTNRALSVLAKVIYDTLGTYIQAISIKMDCAVKCLIQDGKIISRAIKATGTEGMNNNMSFGGKDAVIEPKKLEQKKDEPKSKDPDDDIPYSEYRDVKEMFIELQEAFTLYEYDMFLLNCQSSDNHRRAVLKTITLAESSEMNIILEATMSDMINKLVARIAEIFTRFSRTMSDVVFNDKAYWEKNKAIAAENYAGGAVKECRTYVGLQQSKEFNIPAWNYDILKESLVSEAEFIAKYFSKYAPKEGANFSDTVKNSILGDNKEYGTGFPLKNMYEFCSTYTGSTGYFKSITKDMDDIRRADKATKVSISQAAKETAVADPSKEKSAENNPESAKESGLSSFYKSYFNEVEIEATPTPNKVEGENTDTTRKANTDAMKRDVRSGTTADVMTKAVKIYFTVCGAFMAAKMTTSQQAYSDYRKIMMAHIKATRKNAKKETTPAAPGEAEPAKETPPSPEAKK